MSGFRVSVADVRLALETDTMSELLDRLSEASSVFKTVMGREPDIVPIEFSFSIVPGETIYGAWERFLTEAAVFIADTLNQAIVVVEVVEAA